jgi:hypothetical protein
MEAAIAAFLNMKYYIVALVILISAVSCMSQKQGIVGQVLWVDGNQMPGPDSKNSPAKGIEREIYIYEAAMLKDTKRSNGFFSEIRTPLVAKVISDETGTFRVLLPEGEYSVFTKEPEGLFANIFDGQGRINTIFVKKQEFTQITIKVNYNAAY